MKIEITQYGHKAAYEFEYEEVTLEELLYHLEGLIKLIGYSFEGELQITKTK